MIRDHRCVHLDFHTYEGIKGIGRDFDKEAFKAALKEAELDSITLFAKCHHGNFYYFSDRFATHPYLEKPLLDLQIEACREAGVSAKIYISAGHDEQMAIAHPEWLVLPEDGVPQPRFNPYFHYLCFNSPYMDILVAQTEEVTRRYMPDGLFFDIITECACVCNACRRDMKKKGLDYTRHEDVMRHAREVLVDWTARVSAAARAIKPDILLFFNAGDFPVGRHDRLDINDQLEAESLPTGGYNYDHFPMSMSYIRREGKNCIGMTGKFHGKWGEFGGYKYKDALLYEGAQCLAFDAGMSVGDQLDPTGRVDAYTYESIGNAMRYMKAREPWRGGKFCAELAVLSDLHLLGTSEGQAIGKKTLLSGRTGLSRMLFEGKFLFDIIGWEEINEKYPLIILADEKEELSEEEYFALKRFTASGGKLLASGRAPLYKGKMAFDLGAEYIGKDSYRPSYLRADYPLAAADGMALVLYEDFHKITLTGEKLGDQIHPYFERGGTRFCSHNNTPANYDDAVPAITEGQDGIYIAADIFSDYAACGSLSSKQIVLPLVEKLLRQKTVASTNLPSSGKLVLYQRGESYICHLLYANMIKRGDGIEVIEDLVTLSDIEVRLRLSGTVDRAVLHPEERELPFARYEDGSVGFRLARLYCSAIIELS